MADNIFITGAAEGAFAEALNGLPPWATQKTAEKIEKNLRDSLNVQNKMLSKLVSAATGKGNGGNAQSQNELAKSIKDYLKALKDAEKAAKKKLKDDKEAAEQKLALDKKLASSTETAIFILGGLAKIGSMVRQAAEQNIKTYAELQQGGINVVAGFDSAANGFQSLQQMTALTGVRFTELSATMLKYNNSVNAFTAGKFAKTVGLASTGLQQFGFSSKESAELLGSYLETQVGYADIQNKTSEETSAQLVKFGANITKLSMATGMAKNALLANIEAIAKSNEASTLSANIGENAATSTLEFISSFKDQNIGRAFLKMMTDQIKPLNETFMSFQKIGLGDLSNRIMAFQQSIQGLPAEEAAEAMAAFVAQNNDALAAGARQANLYTQIPDLAGAANSTLTMINGMRQQARIYVKEQEADNAKLKESNVARSKLASQWEALMSKFQQMFTAPISLLNSLGNSLEWLNGKIDSTINFFNSFGAETSSWIGIAAIVTGALAGLSGVKTLVSTLFSATESATGIISRTFSVLGSIGSMVVRFLGILGAMYGAFEIGQAIGDKLYEFLSKFSLINSIFDVIFRGLDKIISYLPNSMGSDARARIEERKKQDAKDAATPKTTKIENANSTINTAPQSKISVPKDPRPSTIESPSAVTPLPKADTANISKTPVPNTPIGPGIEKPPNNSDINNVLAFQSSLLEQILLSSNNLVSVNKDILKYTRHLS